MRRVVISLVAVVGVVAVVVAAVAWRLVGRDIPERFDDAAEEFKYGSIGAEARFGVPWHLWRVLPALCENLVPQRPNKKGWEHFGFMYEPGHVRPVGTSLRQAPIAMVGLNCAACHAGGVREGPFGALRVVPGMPAHQLDLEGYAQFLVKCGADPRFNERKLIAVMHDDPSFTRTDEEIYRRYVIPHTREALARLGPQVAWRPDRPPPGPGRVDALRLLSMHLGREPGALANEDFPSLFLSQGKGGDAPARAWGWGGSNASRRELGIVHALLAGATESSVDLAAVDRTLAYTAGLTPPRWPRPLDEAQAARGRALFDARCASCHGPGGASPTYGPMALADLATDPTLAVPLALDEEMVRSLNSLQGPGGRWRITGYRATRSYVTPALTGLWLRGPYLHNGSVPSLRALLTPPAERPTRMFRGTDIYNYQDVGFDELGCPAGAPPADTSCLRREFAGTLYTTNVPGNSAQGHVYGTDLPLSDRDDLLEYLKTL